MGEEARRIGDPLSPKCLGRKPCCPYRPRQETSSFPIDLLRGDLVAFMFTQGEQLFTFQWGNERLASISSQAVRSEETSRREEDQLASFPLKQDHKLHVSQLLPHPGSGDGNFGP